MNYVNFIHTYQLYYTKDGQKKILDIETKKEVDEAIAKNNLKEYVIHKNNVKIFDSRINPFKKSEAEQAVSDFIDFCEGKIKEKDYIKESNIQSNIQDIKQEAYGDWIFYKDGTKEFRNIGD